MLQGLIVPPASFSAATMKGQSQLYAMIPDTTVVLTTAPASVLMATRMRMIPWDASAQVGVLLSCAKALPPAA
jgi:hypothetical protein